MIASVRRLSALAAPLMLLVMMLTAAGYATQSFAQQDAAAPVSTPLQQASDAIDNARKQLTALSDKVDANARDDARLVDIKAQVDELGQGVIAATVGLRPRFEEIKTRLTAIGDPPKDGQPAEAAIVTDERNRLTAERSQINAITGDAENVSIDITKLSNQITQNRRDLFSETLLKHTDVTFDMFGEAGEAFITELSDFRQTVGTWFTFVWKFKRLSLAGGVFLSLAAALLFFSGSRRLLGRYVDRNVIREEPSYISRLSVAFWSTMIPTLTLVAFLVSSYFFMMTFNVLRTDIAPIVSSSFGFIGLTYFIWRLSHAVLAPTAPEWRLVRVSDLGARQLGAFVIAMGIVNAMDYVLNAVSVALGSPVVLTVVKSFFASVIIGLILVAMSFLKPVRDKDADSDTSGKPWPRAFASLLRTAGFVLILAALIGYIGLSRFLATQIVLTGAVLVTMYIGILSGKAVSGQNSFAGTAVGRFLQARFKMDAMALDQTGLVAGLLIYLFALVTGIPLILLSWGFQIRDLQLWGYRLFTQISIGNMSISLVGIFGGILIFAIGMVLTRWFQKWLDRNVMARSHVDSGVRNSVKTGIGYIGVGFGALMGISAAGIDLSSLALVAGALSLGIGFGLQNIVSNFVSGLILLVERPFKVGDWVVTGTTEGTVKRISVRATEIETFRRQAIIVPNSAFINASVGNWTHRNRIARSEIPVGVSYSADPRKVMDILLELAKAHPLILRNPEPQIEFLRFGDFSLDFELRFFLADLSDGLAVRNELRIQIFERFKTEGIEIPFPQRNLNINMQGDADLLAAMLAEGSDTVTVRSQAGPKTPSDAGTKPDGEVDGVTTTDSGKKKV